MSHINPLAREISAKIVYYGPGLSGKTTSLKYLYSVIRPERRGELVTLATEGDRTLFFDFLPISIERVQEMPVRLQLYTVPGQVFYSSTRKLVLNGADGVVFVADSQEAARESNLQSLQDMMDNLTELGHDLATFPHVLQFNKRDLTQLMSVAQLNAELNRHNAPALETCAAKGTGILNALREITQAVVRDLKRRQPQPRKTLTMPVIGEGTDTFEGGLAARLSQVVAEGAGGPASTLPGPSLPPPSAAVPPPSIPPLGSMSPTPAHGVPVAQTTASHPPQPSGAPAHFTAPAAPVSHARAPTPAHATLPVGSRPALDPLAIPPPTMPFMEAPPPAAGPPSPSTSHSSSKPPTSGPAAGGPLSFAALWPVEAQKAALTVEQLLREGAWGSALRSCAAALAALLESIPGVTGSDGPMTKAALLGLDGREYLRFCRMASAPDAAITQVDALFAYHMLISARMKQPHI